MGGPLTSSASQETLLRRLVLAFVLVLALAVAAVPAFAAGKLNVPAKLSSQIAKAHKRNDIAVLLPSRMKAPVAPSRIFGRGSAGRNGYHFELGIGRDCNGANVCYVAGFFAKRGGTPSFKRTVKLVHGMTGYYKPVTCGASCSPAVVQWVQGGVLYEIQSKAVGPRGERKTMIGLANGAIRHGAR
jgi:hypothetical protein